jgi:hypothetical protein
VIRSNKLLIYNNMNESQMKDASFKLSYGGRNRYSGCLWTGEKIDGKKTRNFLSD